MSLNPALEDVHHCPRCGAPPQVDFPRSIRCTQCGYGAFYNPKPVACTIVHDDHDRIVLMRRATEPGKGRWTMPGGFVDLGESTEAAARRETREEIGIEVEIGRLVGVYSRGTDRIVVITYTARALGTPVPTEEALEVRAFDPTDIPWEELAFWSDDRALRDCLATRPSSPVSSSPPSRAATRR
jgi:ADP-ribose pyrophosphatase YjhB (NUDIX family)